MKTLKKSLALALVLILALGMAVAVSAAEDGSGFDSLPAGTYTYVNEAPVSEAGSGTGQVQFRWTDNTLTWAYDGKTGSTVLTGDELEFFRGLYISDRPLYDWLASDARNTEGYEGNVANYFRMTFTEDGKLSWMRVDSGITNVIAILSADITAGLLTVEGAVRGQPNLLQSSITLMGSTNGLYLTDRGNAILNELSIGHDATGLGLKADKTGGDTFIAGTVKVDGRVDWFGRYANLQPIQESAAAVIETNGQDMYFRGCSVGRMGRNLSFVSNGGDIIIGDEVTTDYGRNDPLPDPSQGALNLSTSGRIDAGTGDVVIGTNSEKIVTIDKVGDISGANVTIKPTRAGTPSALVQSVGDITATGSIDIELGSVNTGNAMTAVVGSLTAGGDITIVAGEVNGILGDMTAGGAVDLKIGSAYGAGEVTGASVSKDIGEPPVGNEIIAAPIASTVLVDGKAVAFDAYNVEENNYFRLRDVAYALTGSNKEFDVNWYGTVGTIATLTSTRGYAPVGGELAAGSGGEGAAIPTQISVYLDGKPVSVAAYSVNGEIYFKLRDLGAALDFGVSWDGAANAVIIDTGAGYTA